MFMELCQSGNLLNERTNKLNIEANSWQCVLYAQDTNIGVPVTMHVDPKGYFVYWHDQNQVSNVFSKL